MEGTEDLDVQVRKNFSGVDWSLPAVFGVTRRVAAVLDTVVAHGGRVIENLRDDAVRVTACPIGTRVEQPST